MPKPKRAKAEVMWMIWSKNCKFLPPMWGKTKKECLSNMRVTTHQDWQYWKDKGYRCVKVNIEEVK